MTTHKHTLFPTKQSFNSLTIKQTCGQTCGQACRQAFRWLSARRNLSFLLAGLCVAVFTLAGVAVRAAKDGGVKARRGNFATALSVAAPVAPKVAMGTNII